ncbi:hypothetical protein NVP1121O_193 [Vibrio phage 1.121.O._10N.286.46.C4]|nr:hypothetical protein NVP1121O_193 [Vibrio phage 1.121.O._10N.286.46.C4]
MSNNALQEITDALVLAEDLKLTPFAVCINHEDIDYNSNLSDIRIDTDGDLHIDLSIDSEDLLGGIDKEVIAEYLRQDGYHVEEL